MAVKGSATVTLSQYRDTESVTRYYKLQSSSMAAPDKPANVKPNETPAGWSKAEPACDITKTLYTCDVTVFSDKTTHVSDVSKSTSYEAAKEAWNKAQTAQNTATEAAKTADNYISTDSTGIMVSENKGATKETPSNATKNNVLITEKDVQIRNGQKVVATYGDTITLGDKTGEHAEFTNSGFFVSSKNNEQFSVKGFYDGELFHDRWVNNAELPGHSVDMDSDNIMYDIVEQGYSERTFKTTFEMKGPPKKVAFVFANGTELEVPTGNSNKVYYTSDHNAENVVIVINGTSGGTMVNWNDVVSFYIDYEIGGNPSTARFGEGATKDVNESANGTYYDYKAFKVGKGKSIGGQWQDENAFEVEFDGTTSVGGSLAVNGDAEVQALYSAGPISTSGVVACKELVAQDSKGDELSFTRLVSGTGKATAESGSVYMLNWTRCGTLATVELGVKATASIAAGKNISTGKVAGVPKPVTSARGTGAYGVNAILCGFGTTGNYWVRNCGTGSIASGKTAIVGLTYMTDGTML